MTFRSSAFDVGVHRQRRVEAKPGTAHGTKIFSENRYIVAHSEGLNHHCPYFGDPLTTKRAESFRP
jgi:hypothetical protein